MGEKQNKPFQLSFNGYLKVDFQGSRVTSDGGLILVRELDERLGLGELIAQYLSDPGSGRNTQLPLADLLRQSVYSRLAGYEDVNDAERVSLDPTFRLISSQKLWERGAALTSSLHSFETELLASEENFTGLADLNRHLLARAEGSDAPKRVVLDMDSTESPVHGHQEHSAYNGHFESVCYPTRCCCSTARATAWRRSCGRAMCTALRTGRNCYCRRSSVSRHKGSRLLFGRMRLLPSRKFMRLWRSTACTMPFAFRRTRTCGVKSLNC